MKIAIVAVAYNRVDSLTRLLRSLETAYYPQDKGVTLIISVDKSNTDVVERFADEYKWGYGEKIVDKHEKNLGLRPHMISLGKWFDSFDAIIVLEDDLVVSPNFYTYTQHAVEKYHNVSEIAGISLYSFGVNYQTGSPFTPIKDEYDAYFMNCAMSWGEVWMRDSWNMFHEWYLQHQEFPNLPHLPNRICEWNTKSWLKYHTRYCIEENKYFVHPYISLTTNYGDAGVHSSGNCNTIFQVLLQEGQKKNYNLPDFGNRATYYDGFLENKGLYDFLNLGPEELCLDLQCYNHNKMRRRYWLTPAIANYKIISSYGLNFRPIEKNIFVDNHGNEIFLYDTTIVCKNEHRRTTNLLHYLFYIDNLVSFIKRHGISKLMFDLGEAIKIKFRR